MDERLRIETVISLMESSNKEDIERLKVAYGNYNIAKRNCEPFIEDLKSGMASINATYKEAGMDAPFVLSYEDLENDLKVKSANIKDLEARRDEARREYISIEEDTKKYPGLTYGEVKEKQESSRKTWDELNDKVDEAWRAFRKAEEEKKTIKKDEFNEKCNSYEYLKAMVEEKKDLISSTFVNDERTTNMIKVQLYSLGVNLDSLKGKFGVLNDSVKVFEEISKKLGINLIYDNNVALEQTITEKVEVTEVVKTEEPEVKEETAPVQEQTPQTEEEHLDVSTAEAETTNALDDLSDEDRKAHERRQAIADENVPLGKRFKVSEIRPARVAPFAKTGLVLGAIGGFCLGYPCLATAAVGAGLAIGAQALYDIVLFKNGGRIEAMEKSRKKDDQYSATWVCASFHQAGKIITDKYREMKKSNKEIEEEAKKTAPTSVNNTIESLRTEEPLSPDVLDVNDVFASIDGMGR